MFVDQQHPRLRKNSLALLEKLRKIRGYDFVTGIMGPQTKQNGTLFPSLF